jgi:hypothetical protein
MEDFRFWNFDCRLKQPGGDIDLFVADQWLPTTIKGDRSYETLYR